MSRSPSPWHRERSAAAAVCGVTVWSKAVTVWGTPTEGTGGRTHTRADAVAGAEPPAGGRAAAAEPAIQAAGPGPDPTRSVTLGVEPSASSAAGSGECVERSA